MSDSLNTLSLQSIQGEDAWVSVIQKMDEAYADLVQSQVEVEQKNVELEEAKSFSDSIQSAMNDVLIVCDNDGVIEGVNRALTELVGESQPALIGRSLLTFIEQDYREQFQSFRARLQAQPIRDFEIEIQGKDGKVPLSVNCTARLNHRGKSVGMVLVGRALGELQRAYKELNTAHAELQIAQQRLIQSEKMA
ncbi:PAS domain-containing protein, partial [Marisediminitalea sp.]|uniref:PAS domain-containing protein n=1 Tax=Marisediminitalea sp. TaxID=2662268 RepID=UPI0035137F12